MKNVVKEVLITVVLTALIFGMCAFAITLAIDNPIVIDASANEEKQEIEPVVTCSNTMKAKIREMEGFTPIATWDGFAYSYGYGHTSTTIQSGEIITVKEAKSLFDEDIKKFERAVSKFAEKHNLILTQNEFDALVSFVYNLGEYALEKYEKNNNQLIEYLVKGDYEDEELIDEWMSYCHAGGEVLQGLVERRMYEVNVYLYCVY